MSVRNMIYDSLSYAEQIQKSSKRIIFDRIYKIEDSFFTTNFYQQKHPDNSNMIELFFIFCGTQ